MKIRVGIVGVSGYAGLELMKLIQQHPSVELVAAMDVAELGEKSLDDLHPRLRGMSNLSIFPPRKSVLKVFSWTRLFCARPTGLPMSSLPGSDRLGSGWLISADRSG